jgi:hypothetical protein
MAAYDVDGMSQLVCEDERTEFQTSVQFLDSARESQAVRLEDFQERTETSDGTSVTMTASGRVASGDAQGPISARVRLLRDGGEWCITGERDGFRSVQNSAEDVYRLSFGSSVYDSTGGEWMIARPRRITPDGPPPVTGEATTTGSGLTYMEIEVGNGETPQSGQTVYVHYTMWLEESGKRIDSSLGRDPFEFVLGSGEVVDGFDEGLSSMREGGKRRLIVPPRLGYGRDDDYGDIPINSTLIFDVELVEVR